MVAINPNTVSKAYRELEMEGLVEGRAGVGTFVTRTLAGPSLAAHGELRRARCSLGSSRLGEPVSTTPASTRSSRPRCATLARMESRERCDRSDWAREALRATVGASEHIAAGAVGTGGRTRRLQRCGQDDPVAPDRRTAQRSEGQISVLGGRPGDGEKQLARVGFVAQDAPLYTRMNVADHFEMASRLNPHWDSTVAGELIERLDLDPRQRAGSLSGGQHAQLALALAIGKRPELLVLDEPVASLDPWRAANSCRP